MLKKFAAALVATALIAGPALAASSTGTDGAKVVAISKHKAKHAKTVKHVPSHHRNHVVLHKTGKRKVTQHVRLTTHHRRHVAHAVKPAKQGKSHKTTRG
jgi:hypothetical protein